MGKELATSGGLVDRAVGGAEVCPVLVWSQFFAANRAISGFFDRDAAVKRYANVHPLTDRPRRNAKDFSQCALASNYFCGSLDWVHGANFSAANDCVSIAPLNIFMYSIAK